MRDPGSSDQLGIQQQGEACLSKEKRAPQNYSPVLEPFQKITGRGDEPVNLAVTMCCKFILQVLDVAAEFERPLILWSAAKPGKALPARP